MEILALLCVAGGLFAYLKILWQVRTSRRKIKPEKVIDNKLNALLLSYIGIGLMGFSYPPLESANSYLIGINSIELWTSLILAIPICIYIGVVLRHYKHRSARIYPYLLYMLVVIGNSGTFLLLNGALDFKPPEQHLVEVNRKQYISGGSRSKPTYLLVVNDWNNPNNQLRLDTSHDLYEKATNGTKIQVEVGSGLLGVQWVKSIQLLPQNHL